MEGHFRLGPWLVQPNLNTVVRNGTTSHLTPKAMKVLVCLAEHSTEPVAKEELLQTVWPDTFVGDDVLKGSIAEIRRVFEDDTKDPRFIQTIAKRGYRLIAPVECVDREQRGSAGELKAGGIRVEVARNHKWIAGSVLACAELLFVLLGAFDFRGLRTRLRTRGDPQVHSLAVLPLRSLSSNPDEEYFSDGMTDALITELAQIGTLKVISGTSSMQYKQTNRPLPEIARELNVDGIVEGTVQRSGDRVRITAQLIHAPSDKHLWASSYERDLRDVFALEQQLAGDIAGQVRARIMPQGQAFTAQPQPVNLEVLEAYLQGNFHLTKSVARRDEELRKAGNYFQRAIDADPTFVSAYLGLAEAHHNLFSPSSEDFGIMQASAATALELAPTSSDAHEVMGRIKFDDWNWAGAEEECRRAIELNPNNAQAHHLLGDILDAKGQIDQGWKEYEISQELDPNQDHLSDALRRRGEYDRAIGLLRRTAESDPENATIKWALAENYARKGLYGEWVQEWGNMATLLGFPEIAARVRVAYAKSGYVGALRQKAEELERAARSKQGYLPGVSAETYVALGDSDRAFYWLEQGCEHRHQGITDPLMEWVKIDPGFASLRSDPRFNDVLRCMGLLP